MTIDRLSSTAALIATLRTELTRKSERTAQDHAAGVARNLGNHGVKRRDVGALRRELVEIVKGIAPDDAGALSAARSRVIRSVLLWEFGAELREYSEWQPMLDTLLLTLEGSEQHRVEFSRLVRELQARTEQELVTCPRC